ncbi:WD40-repeat-containing domain protein [Neurospora tetraspora]|uniref:Mitochondrial division protein 1 n=1 Tax=Neurospora tetraspora TaxID=94610 RepID=A0AAE0JPH9_9PEZI|nr:WD40-repeat-containing domain protein [Neurospora tetraspora]
MPKTQASPEGTAAEPPHPKRRRLPDDDASSMPRYSSPAEDMNRDEDTTGFEGRSRAHRPLARRDRLSTSPNRARDASASRSRSRSGRSRTKSISPRSDEDEQQRRYRSRSSSRSRESRSRSSSRSRSRSYSRSPTRSRSPPSRSRSRSRSRTSSTRDRSRSVSPSRFQDRRSSKSHAEQLRPNYRPRLELSGHTAAISQVRISPDGRWIASASADGSVKIWDATTGHNLDTLIGHMAGVSCLTWAPDSNTLATGSDDKAIRLWDRVTASPAHACGDESNRGQGPREYIRGGSQLRTARGGRTGMGPLLGHHNYVYCLAFSPKGNILASGSYDEAVFLWDVRAGRLMRSLPAHSDPVSGIDFCCDGTLVVSCSTDGLIRIWDTSTGQCLRTLVHEDNPAVTNVCFSPNGRFVLAFNLDNSIRLWDYVSGTVKKTYQGHKNSGFSIGGGFGVVTDNKDTQDDYRHGNRGKPFVVSASEDGDIVMWDVVTKQIVQRIEKAHEGVCFWVDVNGDTMVSSGQDCTIKVYKNVRRKKDDRRRKLDKPNDISAIDGTNGHGNGRGIDSDEAMGDDDL